MYCFSDIFYILIYYIIPYRKKVSYQNLTNAFPTKNKTEIKQIQRKFYKHFCDTVFEGIRLISMKEKEIMKRCVYKNPEIIDHCLQQNKSVCLALGHYGNWELATNFSLIINAQVLIIYKPLRSKMVDKILNISRSKSGAKLIPVKHTVREMLKYKKQNINTVTAFITDQTPKRYKNLYWTQFLNQDTPIFLGIEKLARKYEKAVFFAKMHKRKRGYYEIEFIDIAQNAATTKPFEITEAHTQILEKHIIEEPAYWLWTHKRWKHKKS